LVVRRRHAGRERRLFEQSHTAQIAIRELVVMVAQPIQKGLRRQRVGQESKHGQRGRATTAGRFRQNIVAQRPGLVQMVVGGVSHVPHRPLEGAPTGFVAQPEGRQQVAGRTHTVLGGEFGGNDESTLRGQDGDALSQLHGQAVRNSGVSRGLVRGGMVGHGQIGRFQYELRNAAAGLFGMLNQLLQSLILCCVQIVATSLNQIVKVALGPWKMLVLFQVTQEEQSGVRHTRIVVAVFVDCCFFLFLKDRIDSLLPKVQVRARGAIDGHLRGRRQSQPRLHPKGAHGKVGRAHPFLLAPAAAQQEAAGMVTSRVVFADNVHGVIDQPGWCILLLLC